MLNSFDNTKVTEALIQPFFLISTSTTDVSYKRVVKGRIDHVSRKMKQQPFLKFAKNIALVFHASRKIKENVLENHSSRRLWKSRFTRKEIAISYFTGNNNSRSQVTKIPYTTLLQVLQLAGTATADR